MKNVLPVAGRNGRKQIGTRGGLVRTLTKNVGTPNGLAVLRLATNINRRFGPPTTVLGGSVVSGGTSVSTTPPTTYSVSLFSTFYTVSVTFNDADYATSDGAGFAADRLCGDVQGLGSVPHSDAGRFCWWNVVSKAYGGAVGSKTITRVHIYVTRKQSAGDGQGPWYYKLRTIELEDKDVGGSVGAGAASIVATCADFVGPYLLVGAGKYVYVLNASRIDTGRTYLYRFAGASFSWVVESLRCTIARNDIQTDFEAYCLYGYRGSPSISGPVTGDTYNEGSFSRSAVDFLRVNLPAEDATTLPTNPITYGVSSPLWNPGVDKFEDHGEDQAGFRTAEIIDGKGRVPVAIGVSGFLASRHDSASGLVGWQATDIYIGTPNDGFSIDGVQKPDGSRGYWNMLKVSPPDYITNGAGDTHRYTTQDIASRKADWQTTGWFNDIPWDVDGAIAPDNGMDIECSLSSIATDTQGGVYFGGSFNDNVNVRSLDDVWMVYLGGHVPRGCLDAVYDPDRGRHYVVAASARNNAWDYGGVGSTPQASVWMIDARSGDVFKWFDLGSGIKPTGVGALGNGWVGVSHQHVT